VIGEPTFADAILDRIVHNVYRFALEGPSDQQADPRARLASPEKRAFGSGRLVHAGH
jgi:hypothetical protein